MHRLRRVQPECPAEAILPDTESGLEKWLELNANYSSEWPNITRKKDLPADADEHKGEEGKFDKYFSADPGEGDLARRRRGRPSPMSHPAKGAPRK